MRPDNTVQIDRHAAATLDYIRASMQAAASLAVPGSAGIAMGGVGLLATALAVMTLLLWLQANLQSIPGVWLLLYGCALVSASAATNRMVGVMGGAFVAFGLLALASPPSVQLILLGAGFGPLHVIFGILIGRNPHDG